MMLVTMYPNDSDCYKKSTETTVIYRHEVCYKNFPKKIFFIKKAFIFTLTRFDGDVWEEIPSFLGQNFFIS